jgi:hypothetical protein
MEFDLGSGAWGTEGRAPREATGRHMRISCLGPSLAVTFLIAKP